MTAQLATRALAPPATYMRTPENVFNLSEPHFSTVMRLLKGTNVLKNMNGHVFVVKKVKVFTKQVINIIFIIKPCE